MHDMVMQNCFELIRAYELLKFIKEFMNRVKPQTNYRYAIALRVK